MKQLRHFLEMIKFSHTVFALPFAALAACLAARGLPEVNICLWILCAMVGARSAAMSFNRIVDRKYDAENPRTKNRHLPQGLMSLRSAVLYFLLSLALFLFSAYSLNWMALVLSPFALLVILGYSYTKRFTSLSHFVLGLALGIAPLGAWVAVRGALDSWLPVAFGVVVLLWTAGFDLLYACQDYEFDKERNLFSIPVKIGIRNSMKLAKALHALMLVILTWMAFHAAFGFYLGFQIAVLLVALLLAYEHMIVKHDDLRRINEAFLTVNGMISATLMAGVLLDVFVFGA